ncbi:MAG: hypothetical protein ACD_12C00038G0001 [uncultured bacterium]|nr:MAG: hypothetical protein ACD_12C00038G0001 [uncultured bacterium]
MKVFFTASMRGQKAFKKYYQKIYYEIEKLGYKHLDQEVIALNSKNYYQEIEKGGRKEQIALYKRKIQCLHEADICIFECSLHSLSIGYVIQKSLDFNKPTVVLYYKDNLPYFLMGAQEEKLIIRTYTEHNYKKILKATLKDARERKDKRFNFFISPKLLNFIEKTSKEQGITKSRLIRSLIFDYMKKNPLIKLT